MDVSGILKTMVPITQFNKGKASQLFSKAQDGNTLVVVRNNTPVAVIVSLDEYELLRELVKACKKTTEKERPSEFNGSIKNLLLKIDALDEK